MFKFWRDRRRKKVKAQTFPAEWLTILQKQVNFYPKLPDDFKKELQGHIQVFISEKPFIGAGGQDITDEIRVIIAAYACLLLVNRETDYYPLLDQIVVYPSTYVAETEVHMGHGIVMTDVEARHGESWQSGQIVLSWHNVEQGIYNPTDGQNVVFHEFAHQLDQQSGSANGAPVLKSRARYSAWATILGEEYELMLHQIEHQRKTFFDEYGATDPAEFFAVITEFFFERPIPFQQKHPKLYHQLTEFYKQDPSQYS